MKKVLLILMMMFSVHCFAGQYVCKTHLEGAAGWVLDTDKSKCIERCPEGCHNIEKCPKHPMGYPDLRKCKVGKVDDLAKPILRAANDSPVKLDCADENDCAQKAMDPNGDGNFSDRVCKDDVGTESIPDGREKWDLLANWEGITGVTGPYFIWCSKQSGAYLQKDDIVVDTVGEAAAIAEDAAKAVKEAENANIEAVMRLQNCGRQVLALVAIRNVPKSLTRAQKKTLKNTYQDAKDFLELGSLTEARAEVDEIVPDGTIVTSDDKTKILEKIDECLGS